MGVNGKLNIGAAGVHTNLLHDGNGCIPKLLVLLVRQGLCRCNSDAVAGVNPHGINVFNGAYNHYIAGVVPHHLKLILFPAQHGLLQHNLGDEAGIQSFFCQNCKFFRIVGHTAAGTAKGEAGPYNNGKPDLLGYLLHLMHIGGKSTFRNF